MPPNASCLHHVHFPTPLLFSSPRVHKLPGTSRERMLNGHIFLLPHPSARHLEVLHLISLALPFWATRTWSDLRTTMEDLLVRPPGDSEPWRLPPTGRMSGAVDFQPLPPCMANMCNASGACTHTYKYAARTNTSKYAANMRKTAEMPVKRVKNSSGGVHTRYQLHDTS